jgi:beta-galactosidase
MSLDRREFLQGCSGTLGYAVTKNTVLRTGLIPPAGDPLPPRSAALFNRFLFGASVYPELQTRDEWLAMLDAFHKARFTVLRLAESSWGNLQTSPDDFAFGWLRQCLNDLAARNMSAILGTSTYIAPQWLSARHPEVLRQMEPGTAVHPMGRKAACINHPLYRQACRHYISALGEEFKDHPAVIGWQLDNEIEFTLGMVCYNPACEHAWKEWLKKTYKTPEELNQRWDLTAWGMPVDSLEEVSQIRYAVDPAGTRSLATLALANLHFRRDSTFDFFDEQRDTLRQAGVTQWITTDWNDVWTSLADDPRAPEVLDIAGLNYYPKTGASSEYWKNTAWQYDIHRSGCGIGRFLITETTAGTAGGTEIGDISPTREQVRMWALEPVAFGAGGLLYWSGNRWRGGPWPYWGALLDWTGRPEPELEWASELGVIFEKWGGHLLQTPVKTEMAVITDFDQRSALATYPNTPSSRVILRDSFQCGHRLGLGVDGLNVTDAATAQNLERYRFIILAADSCLNGNASSSAISSFVQNGGNVLVTPFNGYQSWDGIFTEGGLGANCRSFTGVTVYSARRTASSTENGPAMAKAVWDKDIPLPPTPISMDSFWEALDVETGVEILARFEGEEEFFKGKPAVARKRIGKGGITKLAFWPTEDALLTIAEKLMLVRPHPLLSGAVPSSVHAVPRSDGSLFLINTGKTPQDLPLVGPSIDRLNGRKLVPGSRLDGYGVLWLEEHPS